MATLYAFKFNNYYNRRVKKFNNLNDYPEPEYIETGTYCNFNPNDGINTEIVLGRPGHNNYYGDCDYFIYSDDNINITSRWFIIEQTRKMGNQYKVLLHRDVVADNLDKILSSECFIEKAILPNTNNLIFNKENVSVNQIKKGEHLLKDETGVAWIVGYLPSDNNGGNYTFEANVVADYTANTISDFETDMGVNINIGYRNQTTANIFSISTGLRLTVDLWDKYNFKYNATNDTWSIERVGRLSSAPEWYFNSIDNLFDVFDVFKENFDTTYFTHYANQMTPSPDNALYSDAKIAIIEDMSSKIVKINTGNESGYYKIVTITGSGSANYTGITYPITLNYIRNFIASLTYPGIGQINSFDISRDYNQSSYSLEKVAFGQYHINLPGITGRLHLKDAPYDMFCIPYGDVTLTNSQVVEFTDITYDKSLALTIAQGIAKALTSQIIDLQLVPYCPMTGFNINGNSIDINNANSDRYTAITKESDNIGYILWSTASSGSKNISYEIDVHNLKMSNECDLHRVVSPNYNGQFEFNAAMNNGVNVFNIDFTYIPYQPYIHLNPVFKRMYGANYNDARGLICGGDFSISYLSNAWADYQVKNKNYLNIFDREIQSMEVSHEWEMKQAYVAAAAGAVSGAVSGAIGGGVFGGVGAVFGGLIGAGASVTGGVLDVNMKEALYSEALDYKKDMFGFQLDNIKALPSSLAKVTQINRNNKIFPFIEYYTCSDEEKIALAEKIAWNSMTVGIIGKIEDYVNNSWSYDNIEDKGYIKARLIRFEDVEEDFHNVNAIAEELFKGVYFK